jgi:hypothetical protein
LGIAVVLWIRTADGLAGLDTGSLALAGLDQRRRRLGYGVSIPAI